jgi:hypothetical protein
MSSNVSEQEYSPFKIEKLKSMLEKAAENGRPRYYEIYVDNLKVVEKTCELEEFDDFETYLGEETQYVKILLYSSSQVSPRNDKFIYKMPKAKTDTAQGLQGLDVQQQIENAIASERKRTELIQLQQDLDETNEDLEEARDYITKLEKELDKLRESKNSWKEVQLGNVAAVALEGIMKYNPKAVEKIPLLGALSGLFHQNEGQQVIENVPDDPQPDVAFKPKAEPLSEDMNQKIQLLRELERSLNHQQLDQVMAILGAMAQQPEIIPEIYNTAELRSGKANAA